MSSLSASHIMIVFALEQESQNQFDGFQLIHCGIGKVNAAIRLTRALADYRAKYGQNPQLVLNLGSAGSNVFKRHTLVNCTGFIQRDFDVTGLGFAPCVTPFEDIPMKLTNGQRYTDYAEGICGTGDSFVMDATAHDWNVVDMEAYALAKTCLYEKVPFGCLKFITDGADGGASSSWEEGLAHTARALKIAADTIIHS